MAFTELSTTLTIPGTVILLYESTSVEQNFAIRNLDLGNEDVQVWGSILFDVYIPDPVGDRAIFRSYPCFNYLHVFFSPISVLTGLNCNVLFYANENSRAANVRLWVE